MRRGLASWRLALGVSLTLLAQARPAFAAPDVGSPEATAEARSHFQRGKELYQEGAYREAIVELDKARALDPKAKDLVFNLGIVHEKLGEIDQALRYARLYLEMDLEDAERTRGESYVKRLEGAKAELDARKPVEGAKELPATRSRGRLDAATVVAGVVTLGAVGAGTAFGVKSLADRSTVTDFVTGRDGSYSDLQSRVKTAHTDAVVTDVCFAGAVAAGVTTVALYFARYRDDDNAAVSAPRTGMLTATPTLAPHSAGISLGGAF